MWNKSIYSSSSIFNNKEWMSRITEVSQAFYLRDDTLCNLIINYREYSHSNYMQACEICGLSSFLDLNSNSIVNMSELSGGQRQRLAIARGIYKNADVILLDEATSAIDHKTSHEIIQNLAKYGKNKIIVMSTHDRSLLNYANKIYNVQNQTLNQL